MLSLTQLIQQPLTATALIADDGQQQHGSDLPPEQARELHWVTSD